MWFDNIAIHYSPESPLIAKCLVNLKSGKKIVYQFAMKDPAAVQNWINSSGYSSVKQRLFIHN